MSNEQKEGSFLQHQEKMLKLVEKYNAEYTKVAQSADKTVVAKLTASQQAQAKVEAELKTFQHDVTKFAKQLTAAQVCPKIVLLSPISGPRSLSRDAVRSVT